MDVGVNVEGTGRTTSHRSGLFGLVGWTAAPECLSTDISLSGIALLHTQSEVITGLVVRRADVIAFDTCRPDLIPGDATITTVEDTAKLAAGSGQQRVGLLRIIRADGHTAAAETLLDDRVVRASGHRGDGSEICAAVHAAIGAAEQHVASILRDFDVLDGHGSGDAVEHVLGHYTILDVAYTLNSTVPDAGRDIGVGHERIGGTPIPSIEQAGIRAVDPGP